MVRLFGLWLIFLFLVAPAMGRAEAPPVAPSTYETLPIDFDARPADVQIVPGDDGRRFIVYDVVITNWSETALTLDHVDIEDAQDGRTLRSYDAAALDSPARIRRAVEIHARTPDRTIPASGAAMGTFAVVLEPGQRAPRSLRHRLTFAPNPAIRLVNGAGAPRDRLEVTTADLELNIAPPIVIGAPLRGGPWRCSNGIGGANGHYWSYIQITARLRTPQRYGCDFQKVDDEGNTLPNPFPDDITNSMFYGYGAEVIAVADATVAAVRAGIPENVPQANGSIIMPVPLTNDTVAGNTVTLDLGQHTYAFYAHLQPGSIRVRVGQRVRSGQVLGLVGNAGNSVGPHLHFQLGDAPSLNGSNPRAYVFRRFQYLGRGRVGAANEWRMLEDRMPLQDAVMRF